MKKALGVLIITSIAVAFTSCKQDRENPGISIQEPQDHKEFHYGETIEVKAIFTDDVELADFHVYIGNEDGTQSNNFPWEDKGSLSQDNYTFSASIPVPHGIGIVYYLHFEVTDEKGNSSHEKIMLHFHEMGM